MNYTKINKAVLVYLIFLLFFAIFYLLSKHNVGNDSSVSEWLINYSGGFTRRGLGGEISIYISNLLNITLREAIFALQSILHIAYFLLIYKYIKNLKLNMLQIFAFFAPIFLLYPVAEIEVLGRKEIVLFVFFISFLFFINLKNNKIAELFIFFILPFICLIWEEVVLFCPYIAIIFIIKRNLKSFWESFKYLVVIFLPSVLIFIFIFFSPLSLEGHSEMCKFLEIQFGEKCYMSASMLVTSTIHFDTLWIHSNAHLEHYVRYIWIFVVGFMPLNILVFNSSFIYKKNFITKNLKLRNLFFLLYFPSLILFMYGYDWGRWINITYTFSILLYLFLLKNNLITNDFKYFFKKHKEFLGNRILVSLLFFIFAFGWNPKTVITGDIGSFPWYRIPYKAIKVFDYKFKPYFFNQD